MKTTRMTIAAAIVALAFTATSCGNKAKTNAGEAASTEQVASNVLEIDSLLANAENLAGKEVTIEGVCTHTCKHGAKKIFLMGSDDTQTIRVEAGALAHSMPNV
ncbi:hypothetical protein JCM10512_1707 [Bacteroides reticulotermitis JCM 10512]|uniref:Lipoprotein n=1 Tax=Bacteroides reticulotermitis JCM 10512 TaxID=1445607 RepID=W4UR63_9BACE|nr:hypothetical protein JCM10512_1707 [Bacteroides reticulotermitis JCM 10512]